MLARSITQCRKFFSQTNNDHYIITPVASVSIVDGDFIQSNDDSSRRSANVPTIISLGKHTISLIVPFTP
jgi:hypothetical protein